MPKKYIKKGGQGGKRANSGRRAKRSARRAMEMAERHSILTGKLPHIFLLEWTVTGIMVMPNGQKRVLPIELRLDAAKSAANYFAPKLHAMAVQGELHGQVDVNVTSDKELTDDELAKLSLTELTSVYFEEVRALPAPQAVPVPTEGGA